MAFPIIQFGTSRFLQAHVDLFVSEALAVGEAIGRIVAVQTTANPASRKRIAAFAEGRPYVVQIKGIAAGAIVDREIEVGSVGGGVDANLDWPEVKHLFNEARCMVSNTADRGYETDDSDRPDGPPPRSFPAKLGKAVAGAPPRWRPAHRALSLRADACERRHTPRRRTQNPRWLERVSA